MFEKWRLLRHFLRLNTTITCDAGTWTDGVFPKEYFTKKFVRSSGPGGQNVNKLATKCEIRFNVNEASWLDKAVLEKFVKRERNRISKNGEYTLASDKTRYAESNEEDCYQKLQAILNECVRQVELENRQPTDKDLEILSQKAELSEQRRKQMKLQQKQKRQLRSKHYFD